MSKTKYHDWKCTMMDKLNMTKHYKKEILHRYLLLAEYKPTS